MRFVVFLMLFVSSVSFAEKAKQAPYPELPTSETERNEWAHDGRQYGTIMLDILAGLDEKTRLDRLTRAAFYVVHERGTISEDFALRKHSDLVPVFPDQRDQQVGLSSFVYAAKYTEILYPNSYDFSFAGKWLRRMEANLKKVAFKDLDIKSKSELSAAVYYVAYLLDIHLEIVKKHPKLGTKNVIGLIESLDDLSREYIGAQLFVENMRRLEEVRPLRSPNPHLLVPSWFNSHEYLNYMRAVAKTENADMSAFYKSLLEIKEDAPFYEKNGRTRKFLSDDAPLNSEEQFVAAMKEHVLFSAFYLSRNNGVKLTRVRESLDYLIDNKLRNSPLHEGEAYTASIKRLLFGSTDAKVVSPF